ncbi:MAG: DNA-invertase [Micrococcaceae bacterium]|nr:DNA-invertase [Micrococcaceae bacterium]
MALIWEVSTADQNANRQRDALIAAGVKDDTRHLFTEQGVSGTKAQRAALDKCLDLPRGGTPGPSHMLAVGPVVVALVRILPDLSELAEPVQVP